MAVRLRQANGALVEQLRLVAVAASGGERWAARARWRDFVGALEGALGAEAARLLPLLADGPDRARLRDEHAHVGALTERGGRELGAGGGERFADTMQQLMLVLHGHLRHVERLAAGRVAARRQPDERRRLLAALEAAAEAVAAAAVDVNLRAVASARRTG